MSSEPLPPPSDEALTVADARRLIEHAIEPLGSVEWTDLRSALGRALAEDQKAPADVPPWDCAAMDGYAVRSTDLHGEAQWQCVIVGQALAGRPFKASVGPSQAVRVTTGAPMPAGTDTVVLQELVRVSGDVLHVPAGCLAGTHRRLRGENIAQGAVAVPAGRLLQPADLGVLASIGVGQVPVHRRLRIAYFSSGDELRPLGTRLDAGQIYDCNRYTLFGMLARLGVDLIDMGIVPDDPIALEATLRSASERADVILSSGGVSVGEADFTREVMARLGEVLFWHIAMRPGRPLAFGRIGDALYFGLPGNPVAALTCFYFLVRDALLRLMGAAPLPLRTYPARAATVLRKRAGRTEFQRGWFERDPDRAELVVSDIGDQGSANLLSVSQANCMVVLSHERGPVDIGEWVEVVPFEELF